MQILQTDFSWSKRIVCKVWLFSARTAFLPLQSMIIFSTHSERLFFASNVVFDFARRWCSIHANRERMHLIGHEGFCNMIVILFFQTFQKRRMKKNLLAFRVIQSSCGSDARSRFSACIHDFSCFWNQIRKWRTLSVSRLERNPSTVITVSEVACFEQRVARDLFFEGVSFMFFFWVILKAFANIRMIVSTIQNHYLKNAPSSS